MQEGPEMAHAFRKLAGIAHIGQDTEGILQHAGVLEIWCDPGAKEIAISMVLLPGVLLMIMHA